jgi:PAS domain S-box-containing protein
MNFWTGLHFFCFIVYVFCVFYVIKKNPFAVANWVLSVLFACFALWSFCNTVLYNSGITLETASLTIKIQSAGWAGFITYYFIFVLFLTNNKKLILNPFINVFLSAVSGIFIYQVFNGQMLACCRRVAFGMTAEWMHTPWVTAYYAYYTVMFFAGAYLLFVFRNKTAVKTEKKIADIILLSAISIFVFGTGISVVMKNINVYVPLDANVFFLIFVVGLMYCAEKYEMLSLTGTRVADKIMENINEGLILLGGDGEVLSANRAAMEIFGYDSQETGVFEGAQAKKSVAAIRDMQKDGVEDFEMQVKTPQGENMTVFVSVKPLEGEAGKTESVCIVRNITKRKKAETKLVEKVEELKRSNDELESFAYVASHDLKEPLRMIASYIQLLKKKSAEKFSSDEMDYINFVSEGAMRMDGLISDLLEYSRVKTKGREFVKTDFNSVVSRVLDILKFRIQDKNAKIIMEGTLPAVNADRLQMEQLLQNVIENALKFSASNPPEITIKAEKNREFVQFSVKDNGIGIDMQYKDRIFQVFQRLHPKNEYGGTGVGLAICKKIVERHNGRMWMESEGEGKGSTFYFTLSV